jgi:predicted permease
MNTLISEIKNTAASLTRVPGFVLTTIFTLSLTLGILLAAFSLNHLLIFKALPYQDAQRLILIKHEIQQGETISRNGQIYAAQNLMYRQQSTLESMSLINNQSIILASHGDKPVTNVSFVTPEYFDILTTPMILGRALNQQENVDSNKPSAVISEQLWQTFFSHDENVLNQSITLGNQQYRIVGVISKTFIEPALFEGAENSQVWLPWDFNGQDMQSWTSASSNTVALGKMSPESALTQVSADFSQIVEPMYRQNGRKSKEKHQALVAYIQDLQVAIIGDNKYIGLLVLLGAGVLLLIACANVVNLFFSRAAQRQRALVIQATLGAKLKHLFFNIWLESFLLCAASMVIGLMIAGWCIELLRVTVGTVLPRLSELSLDLTAVAFAGILTLTLSLVFSLITLKLINYKQLISQLQSSGKGSGAQVNSKVRNLLVASQICLATLLLLITSLIMNNALQVLNQPVGFDDSNLYSLRLDIGDGYPEQEDKMQLSRELLHELQNLNGAEQVSRTAMPPIYGGSWNTRFYDNTGDSIGRFSFNTVDTHYFNTIGIKVIAGRSFTDQEVRSDENLVILSQSAAKKVASDQEIIGKILYSAGGSAFRVVGVVENIYAPSRSASSDEAQSIMVYRTFSGRQIHFNIRMQKGLGLTKHTLLSLLDDKFSNLKIWNFTSVSGIYDEMVYDKKLTLWLSLSLVVFALLLAAVGIYGVISYNSQMRRYELGIRMALGAKSKQILREFIKESFVPIASGFAFSMLLSIMLYALAQQHINQWLSVDWLMTLSCMFSLIIISLAACYFPAKKVIMTDPIKALRNE